MKMPKPVTRRTIRRRRKKLIEALESGKYKKGVNRLGPIGGQQCCLGVASELCIGTVLDRNDYNELDKFPQLEVIAYYAFMTKHATTTTGSMLTIINDHSTTWNTIIRLLKNGFVEIDPRYVTD